MGDFKSKDEFVEVLGRVLTLMSTDAEMGPRLRAANTAQKFVFPDQDVVVNITAAPEGQADGHNLVWALSDDVDWEPEVVMTMDSEIANRYFQGRENVAMAIARRRIHADGDVQRALAIFPITKRLFEPYRALLVAEYPHLVE
jgi:hypothetical protein